MKSAEYIKKYFQKSTLSKNSDKHEAVFGKILRAYEQSEQQTPALSRLNIRMKIMKSPVTKLAVAAVVLIVCIIGLTMFNKTSGVVLANVLTQIEKISAYSYQMDMTLSGQQAMTMIAAEQKIHHSILISREYGMKMTQSTLGPDSKENIMQETYLLQKENFVLAIIHAQKTYTRLKIDSTYRELLNKQIYEPRLMVEQILDCKYQNLGRSTIDGIEVEGFQTNDPNYQGGIYSLGKVDVKLWVDVKTRLPVQMELNLKAKDQQGYDVFINTHNFQWNIPVKASDFEPNIPQDYEGIVSQEAMPSLTEESAIKGLKLFIDLTNKFPDKLTPETLQPQVDKLKEAQDQLQDQSKNPQEKANYQNLKNMEEMNITMTVQGLAQFYIFLKQDKKDPAYYGDKVSPGDADKVLMRWKIEDGTYRVIFGDLSAKNVSPQELSELEAKLPK